jgi:hypothetical protein
MRHFLVTVSSSFNFTHHVLLRPHSYYKQRTIKGKLQPFSQAYSVRASVAREKKCFFFVDYTFNVFLISSLMLQTIKL